MKVYKPSIGSFPPRLACNPPSHSQSNNRIPQTRSCEWLTPEQTDKLDERLRQFFADKINGFYSKTYAETRSQIIWRLDFIFTNDTMRTMFASPATRLKMAEAMKAAKL